MIANPRHGQRVQLWYAERLRPAARHHGKEGTVRVVGRGRPRNHGVEVDGELVIVPCGHLRKEPI